MEQNQPAGLQAALHLPSRQSRLRELHPRDDPVLPTGEGANHPIRRVWADFNTVLVVESAHTLRLPERSRPMGGVCDD
jgi:uncharacterized protein (UPF0216 family)